jgi:hypothetical protein
MKGFIQYGARKHHQCAEYVHLVRFALEKSAEWQLGCVIIRLDIIKAFDSMDFLALAEFVLTIPELPIRLKFALVKEILCPKKVYFFGLGNETEAVDMNSGLRQGSPDASFLFALFLNHELGKLSEHWQGRGLGFNFGPHKGKLALKKWVDTYLHAWNNDHELSDAVSSGLNISVLAFLDDMVLLANDIASARIMLDELATVLRTIGLRLNLSKCKWLCDKHVRDQGVCESICVHEVEIEKVEEIKILGSKIRQDASERAVFDHRISCGWANYGKWKHVLESTAPIAVRIRFFMKTVALSMLWCLETTRHDIELDKRLDSAQRRMIRKMMKLKRRPCETWLDWHKRSFRTAREVLQHNNAAISAILSAKREGWFRHIVRFGLGPRQNHIIKFVMAWRSHGWWLIQKHQNRGIDKITHVQGIGKIRRYDTCVPQDAWMPVDLEV